MNNSLRRNKFSGIIFAVTMCLLFGIMLTVIPPVAVAAVDTESETPVLGQSDSVQSENSVGSLVNVQTNSSQAVDTNAGNTLESFVMVDKAEVRQYGFVGIRFLVTVGTNAKTTLAGMTDAKYGTILIPEDKLDGELDLDTKNILNIETTKWQDETTYTAVLAGGGNETDGYIDLPASYYNRPIVARGYVTGTLNGETVTYYTTNTVTRSIGYVAAMNVENGSDKEILNSIADKTRYEFPIPKNITLNINCQGDSEKMPINIAMGGFPSPKNVDVVIGNTSVATIDDGNIIGLQTGTTTVKLSYTKADGSKVNNTFSLTVTSTGHEEVVIPAVAACSGVGKTEGKKCSVCGEILEAQQDIAQNGIHHFVLASDDKYTTAQCTGCEMAGTPYRASATHINVGAIFNSTWSTDGTQTTYVDLSAQLPADFGYVTSMKNSGVSGADFCDTSFKMDRGLRLKQYDYLANIPGVQEFTVTGSNGGTTTVTLTVVTKVVHNEADYAAVPAIITKLSGGGYFELGNDIVSATGSITLVPLTTTNKFSGTFDGCGYVIDGLTGFSGNYGFVGKELTATGVIKNIGFTNVVHTDGCASMLVMTDAGTLQNIYIDYAATGTKSRTMTITSANVVVDNVFVNGYDAPVITVSGQPTMHLLCSDQWVENSYSLDIMGFAPAGVDNMGRYCNWKATGDVYKDRLFASPAALAANATAVANLTAWANESKYWHFDATTGEVTFGNIEEPAAPDGHTHIYDQTVVKYKYFKADPICTSAVYYMSCECGAVNKNVAATFEVGDGNGHTVVIQPAVPADCVNAGKTEGSYCSTCGEVIVAQTDIPSVGAHHFVLASDDKYTTAQCTGCEMAGTPYRASATHINVGAIFNSTWSTDGTQTTYVDLSAQLPADFGYVTSMKNSGVSGADFCDTSFKMDRGLRLKQYDYLANIPGVQEFTVTGSNGGTTTVTLTVVTKVVHNEADYAAVPAIITKLSGGGYFELGNDIVSATGSITLVPLTTTNKFSGTFDGCGYVIDGLTGFSGNYGFVGKELTATGVIKNIGFTNVVHTDGCASMLVMTDAGTLQNIYIDYAATGTKSRTMTITSANVVVDNVFVNGYDAPVITVSGQPTMHLLCSDQWVENSYSLDIMGFAPAGVDNMGRYCNWKATGDVYKDRLFASPAALAANATAVANLTAWANESKYWHFDPTTGVLLFGNTATEGHEYSSEYTFDADSHYRQCTTCGARAYSSAHIYDQEIEKQDYLKTEATCTEGTTYYKSCVCGACDKSESAATFSDGNALGHIIITTPRVEPKCEEAGATSSSKCSGCGQVIKESVEIPATGHDYGALLSVEHYALDCSNGCGTTYYVGNGYINFGMNFDDVNTAWSNDATRTTALDLSSTGVASVESIKLTHNGTTYEIYGGSQLKKGLVVINIGALPYAQIYGDYELSINNGEATKTVTFVTKLIHNAEDYTNVVKAMTRLGNGYYALGCDIEPKVIGGNIEVAPIPANFAGTFDGLGYTIDGLRATQGDNNSAFVKSMTATGVIKNLGLTNVDIASTASDCKFFGQTSAGTYQNIYVSFDSIAASYRFIVAMASDVVVDNIFVDYTNVTDYQNSFTLYALGDMRNNGLTSASKIYGIGGGIIPSWQVRVTEVADHFVAGTWADLKNNTTVWNAVNAFVTEAPEYWTVDSTTGEVNFGRQGLGFKDGETDYTLVYDSSNDKIGLAGDFVFENIRSATGATIAKNNSTPAWSASSKYIVIGNTELAAAAGVTLDTNYAYQITVKDNSIFILADSEWNYQLAVIKFLEEFLGYKYFDKDLTIYEKDNGSGEWYLPTADIYGEPASVELRKEPSLWDLSKEIYYGMGMTHTSEIFIPMRDENGNDVVVGPNGNATSHTSFYFIDPETYLNEHPNYFSTNEIDYSSGTGVSVSSTATQLCYTAHGNAADLAEMQEIVANKIVERALWYYDDGVRNTIVFGAQDKNIRCNCGTCADVVEQYGSLSAANISFTNAVARLVKQKLIDQGRADRAEELTILFLAYQHASTPPNESFTEKFEDNVGVLIASSKTNYSWTFEDEINANNKAEIEGWSKICNQIYYWIYNHNDHDFLAPSNIFETTKANIEFLKENNAKMIYIQSANVNLYNSGFSSFKTYLEAQLLVDVTKSYDDIKSDYFKYYYGEGGSMMEQFFDEVVEYMNSQRDAGVEDFYGKVVNQKCNDPKYWSLAQLEGWMTLCDEALAALDTSDPNYEVYKRHIEIEQIFPRYMLARYGDGNSSYYNYYSNYSGFQTTTTNWFGITSSKFDSEKLKAFRQEFVNDCMRLCITSVYSADSDGTPGTLKHVAEMGNWGVTPDTGWPEK